MRSQAIISILALLFTIFQGSVVFRNFGKGLKEASAFTAYWLWATKLNEGPGTVGLKARSKTPKAEEAGYGELTSGVHYQLESAKSETPQPSSLVCFRVKSFPFLQVHG